MKFIIYGNPVTKKNSMEIIRIGNRPSLIQNKRYREYEKDFIRQVHEQRMYGKRIDKPVEITCIYYRKEKRRVDLTNLLACTDDCLTKAKIIEDDNFKIVKSHDGSRIFFDKENPRVEIEIKEYEDGRIYQAT